MTLKVLLSALSGIVIVAAFVPYLWAAIQKKASPRKATWMIWATGDWILLLGQIEKGEFSWLIAGACFGATTAFILSLIHGEKGWNTLDRVCISLSGVAIALWLYFGESNLGIGFSSLSLLIAAWPTYVSAWVKPENEDRNGWVLFVASSALGVLAIPNLNFAAVVPPSVFLIIDVPMMYLLFIRPAQLRRKAQLV